MAFTVYKSSAGSGKTYTLVREYLKIVLKTPANYPHVLAITFTNKAANEMKERIIGTLKKISAWDPDAKAPAIQGLVNSLVEDTGLAIPLLVRNAGLVLNYILHNYSDFAVSTIDSFIHRVIRSFAFDLNVPVNFEVEMDTDEVLRQVIDILISRAGSDRELTAFLIEFVQSRADEEKNWNIESDLLKIARLLKEEDSAEYLGMNADLSLGDYAKANAAVKKYISRFEAKLQELGTRGKDMIDACGIPPSSFYQGERGIYSFFGYLAASRFDKRIPSNTVMNAVRDDKWVSTKATALDKSEIAAIRQELIAVYEEILETTETEDEQYILFQEIRKNLYPLAILDSINRILEEFKSENNLLLISEFNQLISGIVLDEPVPFIYERVGERFKHFLVDEFQDTSVLQWQNLLPLIDNSLANGYDNLVVGDAKQAIYRWRNGEVDQFVSLPDVFRRKPGQVHSDRENALRQHYTGKELKSNYRSRPGIVNFNNDFFEFARSFLSEPDIRIYDGVAQQVASPLNGGYVQVEFFPPGREGVDFSTFNCSRIKALIEDSQSSGYRLEDIAILCRTNRSASVIARFLLSHNIRVVSSESMLLVNSPEVRLIVSVLAILIRPADHLAAVESVNLLVQLGMLPGPLHREVTAIKSGSFVEGEKANGRGIFDFLTGRGYALNREALLSLPLYDLAESLVRIFNLNRNINPFIQFFLDVVLEQEKATESDIRRFLEFWDRKKNNLSIVVPEGIDAVRIMTIHKAKGLEFPVVIYPFVNESVKKNADSVWIALENEAVPELKAALVGANKSIQGTRYGKVVDREIEKSKLDLLNLLYVVLTRPTDMLYVIADHPENLRNSSQTVSSMLVDYLNHRGVWVDQSFVYSFGEQTTCPVEDKSRSGVFEPVKFTSLNWRNRALISYQAPVNWDVDEPERRQEWGNLIHAILAEVTVDHELDAVLENYLFHGMISAKELALLREIIGEFLKRPGVSRFFKAGLRVYTESEIIAPGGDLFRPDRIVVDDGQTFVIDFKTGVPMEKHRMQMKKYMQVVEQMNGIQPRGVILYLDQEDPVCIS